MLYNMSHGMGISIKKKLQ